MPNETLEGKLRKCLAEYCTGADDHDSENCRKCAEMLAALLPMIQEHATEVAREAPLRCHSLEDVEFHSGCVQTQEHIEKALKEMR